MMDQLTKDYNAQLTEMTALADTLTGEQKTAVLMNIEAMTVAYETKMSQLHAWQQQLLNSMVADADATLAMLQTNMSTMSDFYDTIAYASAAEEGAAVRRQAEREAAEAAMASVIRGQQTQSAVIEIHAPLVNIEGSADEATAERAAKLVEDALRSVIIEPTSSGAPATSKEIRIGSRMVAV